MAVVVTEEALTILVEAARGFIHYSDEAFADEINWALREAHQQLSDK